MPAETGFLAAPGAHGGIETANINIDAIGATGRAWYVVLPSEVQQCFVRLGKAVQTGGGVGMGRESLWVNLGMGEWMMLRFLACIYGLPQAGLTSSSDAYSGSPRVTKCTGYCVLILSEYLGSLDGRNLIDMR